MTTPLPKLGAVPIDDRRTRFTLWAPALQRVSVHFPTPQRSEPMQAADDGYFTLTSEAAAGTLYQFELPGVGLRPDPASRAQPQGVHGPSMVVAPPASPAPSTPFDCPPLTEQVIYELHVGTFTNEGTFDAVIPRLPDLRALGVTAIEIMPIAQFPGERNWGYDGVLPFAAQWSYGGPAALQRLVEACHSHGIAVVLDVVYNHMGPEGNYLRDFGPYFTSKYSTPWGEALNFDGPHSDHVREYFIQNALYWTIDLNIDALRLDAVHAIYDHTARTFIEEFTTRVHNEARQRARRVLIIAESSDNDPRLLRPVAVGGLGFDACWNDDYHHALRAAITGERRAYYKPYADPTLISKTLRDRYAFTGEYSSSHGRCHGAPATDIPHSALVVFTQNHDHVGNRPLGDRLDETAGPDGARLAAALVLLSPFTPMLWMGEEYAETAPFQYFVSHSDPALIEAVRKGRAAEFAEFQIKGEAPDPQSEEAFNRSKLDWSLRDHGLHKQRLAYYTELLRLRKSFGIAHRADQLSATSIAGLIQIQYAGEPALTVLANTGNEPATASLRAGTPLLVLLDSNDPRWGGNSQPADPAHPVPETLRIQPRSVLVLATKARKQA